MLSVSDEGYIPETNHGHWIRYISTFLLSCISNIAWKT